MSITSVNSVEMDAAPNFPSAARIGGCPFELALRMTNVHQRATSLTSAQRELTAMRGQFPTILQPICPGDIHAGRITPAPVGFSPEPGGLGYYCNLATDSIAQAPAALRADLAAAITYWAGKTTTELTRQAYPPSLVEALPTDEWTKYPGIGFPLYRMAGGYLDYDKLMSLGIPGLIEQIEHRLATVTDDAARDFLRCMQEEIRLVGFCAQCYAVQARELADSHPEHRQTLLAIAETCTAIANRAPATMREGLQLAWLYSLITGVMNNGRMDVYLGDLLAADLAGGRLNLDQAQELVTGLWKLIAARHTTWNGRVVLGGKGRRNIENADRFALLGIEASRVVREIEPQLTLRFYRGQNPALMNAAMRCIGEGRTYPMLYNDDVNVPAVMNSFRLDEAASEQYVPFGCGEYVIAGQSVGTPNGVINLLAAVEATIFGGVSALTGRRIGLNLGTLDSYKSFDELEAAYRRQVEYHVAALAEQQKLEYDIVGQVAPFGLLSSLYDDCIARAKPIFDGGVRYLGGTIETYGNINASDSLTALRQLVFEQKRIAPQELMAAIKADFVGHEPLRKLLLAAPKYGNDHPNADQIATRVHEHVCKSASAHADRVGLHSYLVVIINNSANTTLGGLTAASADGRKAREPMANANNPQGGADKSGLTPLLSSLVKLSPTLHAGAVQNMKFSSDMFTRHRAKLDAALGTYFSAGGSQAMITILNRGDLEDAMIHPERHANLMVRVGGFSARFVELERKVQEEILSRTLY